MTNRLYTQGKEFEPNIYHGEIDNLYRLAGSKEASHSLPATVWFDSGDPAPAKSEHGITPIWQFLPDENLKIVTGFKLEEFDVLKVNPIVRVHYDYNSGFTPGTEIRHRLRTNYISPGEALDAGVDETFTENVTIDGSIPATTPLTVDFVLDKSLIAVGDFISLEYARRGANVTDTFDRPSFFIMAEFIYYGLGGK